MDYYYSIADDLGCIHSIDMVYIEYYCLSSSKKIVDMVRGVHEKYKGLKYQEYLDRVPHSKWDFYLDGIAIGGVYVSAGKYRNYDSVNKTFDILNMFEIRVNPNKHFNEPWFQELLSLLLDDACHGMLRKYDYAIDIAKPMRFVQVLDTKKEPGLYKGTRYYGQSGRHGYLKIYDKQKDLKRQGEEIGVLTRVEHTLFARQDPSLERIYILSNEDLETDYKSLKDTDRAIIEMYMQLKAFGYDYDLKLGRGKMQTLRPYIQGQYQVLDYGSILPVLLQNIRQVFHATDSLADEDGFLKAPEDWELPFE